MVISSSNVNLTCGCLFYIINDCYFYYQYIDLSSFDCKDFINFAKKKHSYLPVNFEATFTHLCIPSGRDVL